MTVGLRGYRSVGVQRRPKRGLREGTSSPSILPGSQAAAWSLLRRLNLLDSSTKADVQRVRKIGQFIDDVHEADRIAARTNYSIDEAPKMLRGERRYRLKELLERIETTSSQVRVSVHLWYPERNGWHGGWKYWGSGKRKSTDFQLLFDIRAVVDLAVAGLIPRVRRCRLCSLWYFARRDHQEFCSARCREKNYRGGEQGRTARAAYMRRYRAGLRRRDRENVKLR